jgi:hypothetical protein
MDAVGDVLDAKDGDERNACVVDIDDNTATNTNPPTMILKVSSVIASFYASVYPLLMIDTMQQGKEEQIVVVDERPLCVACRR